MDLQQCWRHFLKAEELLEQGHWPEAHYLYEHVLSHLPNHIERAAQSEETKPCQFSCLLAGLRDSAVHQSEILNKLGQQQRAFEALNQAYGMLQFLSLEESDLIEATANSLCKHSDDLLRHIEAFCSAQRSAEWMLELQTLHKAHQHFASLKHFEVNSHTGYAIN